MGFGADAFDGGGAGPVSSSSESELSAISSVLLPLAAVGGMDGPIDGLWGPTVAAAFGALGP